LAVAGICLKIPRIGYRRGIFVYNILSPGNLLAKNPNVSKYAVTSREAEYSISDIYFHAISK
jgi:hypothetical protein